VCLHHNYGYFTAGHVDIEEFRCGRKGERHTTCNIVWNMKRDQNIFFLMLNAGHPVCRSPIPFNQIIVDM
jgi:hypothetical protein